MCLRVTACKQNFTPRGLQTPCSSALESQLLKHPETLCPPVSSTLLCCFSSLSPPFLLARRVVPLPSCRGCDHLRRINAGVEHLTGLKDDDYGGWAGAGTAASSRSVLKLRPFDILHPSTL